MKCDDFKPLMMGYLDDELEPEVCSRVEAHLAECADCRRELEQFRRMKEDLNMVKFKEPSDAELERYWSHIYNRLERGIGWIMLSLGAIILLSYGGFKLVEEVVKDPEIGLLIKVGILALVFGVVVLFVSLLRERLALLKTDKYSKEVER